MTPAARPSLAPAAPWFPKYRFLDRPARRCCDSPSPGPRPCFSRPGEGAGGWGGRRQSDKPTLVSAPSSLPSIPAPTHKSCPPIIAARFCGSVPTSVTPHPKIAAFDDKSSTFGYFCIRHHPSLSVTIRHHPSPSVTTMGHHLSPPWVTICHHLSPSVTHIYVRSLTLQPVTEPLQTPHPRLRLYNPPPSRYNARTRRQP